MRIGVDVDNTLTKGEARYWRDDEECKVDEEMKEVIQQLYRDHHTIIIWTARPYRNASHLAAWLEKNDIRFHGLRMEKGSCDVYLDDKAIDVTEGDGADLLRKIRRLDNE